MNSYELLQALTDMDDDILLLAQQDPPVRRRRSGGMLRRGLAACAVLVLMLTMFLASDVRAGDTKVYCRIRYRGEAVSYRFRDVPEPTDSIPRHEAAWLPEGYYLVEESLDYHPEEDNLITSRRMIYNNHDSKGNAVSVDCNLIWATSAYDFHLNQKAFQGQDVDIGGITGQLYLTESGHDLLVWVDRDRSIIYSIWFRDISAGDALQLARGLTPLEENPAG